MPELGVGVELSYRLAVGETKHSNHQYVTPGHFFCGITKLQDVLDPQRLQQIGMPSSRIGEYLAEAMGVLKLLQEFKLEPRQARHKLRAMLGDGGYQRVPDDRHIPLAPESQTALERASELAGEAGASIVAAQHLLAALLEGDDAHLGRLFNDLGVNRDELRAAAAALPVARSAATGASSVDKIGVDLVELARSGKLGEVFGRKAVILQVIGSLARETKNNPVLIGDPGVGQTAIVEGIAHHIATGNIDPAFHNKRIIQIDATALIPGTKHRDDFEEWMRRIVLDASSARDVILFVDQIHLLLRSGNATSGMDAINGLRAPLMRGDLQLIGATTDAEYRRTIEKDIMLERRCDPIRVEELDSEDTRVILKGLSERLQHQHQVVIPAEAIDAAVRLSVQYLPDRPLLDKAHDLLEKAAVSLRFAESRFQSGRLSLPIRALNVMTEDVIRDVFAEQTRIPVWQLSPHEAERLLQMEQVLRERVIGQDEAIGAIATAIRARATRLQPARRPVGVFLFVGPTGVGKTELAKAAAGFLFGSDERMICVHLSEYLEKHNVARLVGEPSSDLEHERGGILSEALRKTPHSIVLLEDVDRAHPEVLDIFLPTFAEGRLTDGQGRTVDASHALFIMTSNLGYAPASHSTAPVPTETSPSPEMIDTALRQHFRPEFLNRLDGIIYFQSIRPAHMKQLVRVHLNQLEGMLRREHDIQMNVDEAAVSWLAEQGYDPRFGARPLQRVIAQALTAQIGLLLLSGKLKGTRLLGVTCDGDVLRIQYVGLETLD